MVVSNNAIKIGIIAETRGDIDVIYELTCKIINENKFSFSHFISHGCGKLRNKCEAWARVFANRGISYLIVLHDLDKRYLIVLHDLDKRLIVLHDLDKRKESELRETLEGKLSGIVFERILILIPIEEIESWLLTDSKALKRVFNMRSLPNVPMHPENIENPKKFLRDIVRKNSKSQYINTVHNRQIASELTLSKLKRCPSFSRYPAFLKSVYSV